MPSNLGDVELGSASTINGSPIASAASPQAGSDSTAVHDDTAGEIAAVTEKASPVSADLLLIEDSADSNNKKRVQIGNLPPAAPAGHAASHQHGGADEVATATPAANAIPKAGAGNTLADGWIAASNVTQHQASIDHDALTNFLAAEHVDWAAAGAGTIHTDNYIEGGAGTDTTAIHDDTAGEISAIAEKVSPVGADLLLIEDSAAGNAKKRVQITNLPGGADADAIHDNVAAEISAITEKVTPVSADLLLIEDSADSNNKKRVQVGNLPGGSSNVKVHVEFNAASFVIPSGGGSTIVALGRHMVAELDDAATESISWEPEGLSPDYDNAANIDVEVLWSSPDTAGNNAELRVTLYEVPDAQVLTSENAGTALTQTETDDVTANEENTSTFTFTPAQASLTAGVSFYVLVERLGADANDTIADVIRIRAVRVKQA